MSHQIPPQVGNLQPSLRRAYSVADWQAGFRRAFFANVPVESLPTQARGALLAAENDEREPGDLTDADLEAIDREFGIPRSQGSHEQAHDQRWRTGVSDTRRRTSRHDAARLLRSEGDAHMYQPVPEP